MSCSDHLYRHIPPRQLARRWFLKECGVGLGAIALNQLAGGGAVGKAAAALAGAGETLAPNQSHLTAKEKKIILMLIDGAPTQHKLLN
jgi:hypothetical protein